MSAHPVKYFEHCFDGHKSIAVHRLDELVQVTFTHGPTDLAPDVVFLAPTAAGALVEAIDAAARDGAAVFEAAQATGTPAPRPERSDIAPSELPAWGRPFDFGGLPYTLCPAGDGRVGPGQSAVPETATGRIWHDDCAEAAREGRQSLSCPASSAASAPSGDPFGEVGVTGGADGAAGASGSLGPSRPAAPSLPG